MIIPHKKYTELIKIISNSPEQKSLMKHLFTLLTLAISIVTVAQTAPFLPDTNALEDIIVEKYYLSGPNDVSELPEGSITYRVYADLKPGYTVNNFTAFGVHPFSIRVTDGGEFYNNQFGTTYGTEMNPAFFTVTAAAGIDSWITIAAATSAHLGVLKSDDDTGESLLADDPTGLLANTIGYCDPSLQDADGMITGSVSTLTQLGISSSLLSIFGNTNSSDEFLVEDGNIAILGGMSGPTEENRVLLSQFTTINGTLEFDLNIQIGIPEELQCNVIPSCNKSTIWYTYSYNDQDSEDNTNPNLNYVIYQSDKLSYTDDGLPCNTVGIEEVQTLNSSFGVSPNPSEGPVRITFNEELRNARYELYDTNGKLQRSANLTSANPGSQVQIDLSSLNQGIYILKVISENKFGTKRIVKL